MKNRLGNSENIELGYLHHWLLRKQRFGKKKNAEANASGVTGNTV